MNFRHPEEVMRARILGKPTTCYHCAHQYTDDAPIGSWCMLREEDPAPNNRGLDWMKDPEQACEEFKLHEVQSP